MLSLHDRRVLAGIEQQLRTSTPDLARGLERFDAWAPPRIRHRLRRAVRLAALMVGCVLLVVAFAVSSADAALLGAVVLLADAAWWALSVLDAHHSRRRKAAGDSPASRISGHTERDG
ncbi:DUF3040 domain-containing protein [Actinospica sp.]|jgi:Flp pilus assembly protein TadB|uniref:DUF3040 domain-containing protein n=1 Tax=Actinospica sp. TaxID=1872142 RepID=UPI002D136DFA|nr:DUF3040 domain-containing protein [Actinospica sp.]HWG27223.1 DUF3040 domain-containing protein [Actinospica sp.]